MAVTKHKYEIGKRGTRPRTAHGLHSDTAAELTPYQKRLRRALELVDTFAPQLIDNTVPHDTALLINEIRAGNTGDIPSPAPPHDHGTGHSTP